MFPDYVGEELNPELAEEFREHVARCVGCRQELDLLGETKSTLRLAWPDEAIPENLTFDRPGIASAHRSFGGRLWQTPRVAWLGLAAACFMLCLGTLAFLDARIQVGESGFRLSFGPELPAPVIRQSAPPPQRSAYSEAQFLRVLNQKIGQLEQAYNDRLREALARIETQWKEQQSLDLRQVSGDLNYLEKLQEVARQKTARNEVLISSMADHYIRARLGDTVPLMDQK